MIKQISELKGIINQQQRELTQREYEISLLRETNNIAHQHSDISSLLNTIAVRVLKLIEVKSVHIILLSKDKTQYSYICSKGEHADTFQKKSMPITKGIYAWVYQHKESWLQQSHQAFEKQANILEKNANSALLVPLEGREDYIGGILCLDKQDDSGFNETEYNLLDLYACQVSTAVENTLLISELEHIKMESELSCRAKSLFLNNMSHELITPLNAILGYSELLIEDSDACKQDESLKKNLSRIHLSASHLYDIISEILDLSSIELNECFFDLQEFDVTQVINSVYEKIQLKSLENNNNIHVHLDKNLGIMYADKIKVQQVLNNLVNNACKYTQNGRVDIYAKRFEKKGNDWLSFSISDTGIGINKNKIQDIFKPFSQADFSETRKYGGSGLGLTICQYFTQKMGGNISVASEEGEGTTFAVKLPVFVDNLLINKP